MDISPIAYFHSPYGTKFGIPKQSGIAASVEGTIVFEREYRSPDAVRGLDGFDYLWLIWGFSANAHKPSSLAVRPPRLGGNEKVGVFASRSPFRPNGLGLSSVALAGIDMNASEGPVIKVLGADLMDGTPVYDIKPYITYTDSHEHARSGFVDSHQWTRLKVAIDESVKQEIINRKGIKAVGMITEVLAEDPRPQYQHDPARVYGMLFMGMDIKFTVSGNLLTVIGIS